jgi:hypothetical protein
MYLGLYVRYSYSYQSLMKLKFSRQIFEKYSNIKFHENPSSWRRVITCGQTVMTQQLLVAILRTRQT